MKIFIFLFRKLREPVFEQYFGIDSREPRYKPLKAAIIGGVICLMGVAITFTLSHVIGVVIFIVGWIIVMVGVLAAFVKLIRSGR